MMRNPYVEEKKRYPEHCMEQECEEAKQGAFCPVLREGPC
jgi:hypothetical protein